MSEEVKRLPRVFVGSSVESLKVARAIQSLLQHEADVTIWNQGIFRLSGIAVDDLREALQKSDFGIFVLGPDDVATMRDNQSTVARDNVVLELGISIGVLGRERTFFVHQRNLPKDHPAFHIPTDLIGITPATYRLREDDNFKAMLGAAHDDISEAMEKLGPLLPSSVPVVPDNIVSVGEGGMGASDTIGPSDPDMSDEDILISLVQHIRSLMSSNAETGPYRFAKVDKDLELPDGATDRLIEEAAARCNMEPEIRGKVQITLRYKYTGMDSSPAGFVSVSPTRGRRNITGY